MTAETSEAEIMAPVEAAQPETVHLPQNICESTQGVAEGRRQSELVRGLAETAECEELGRVQRVPAATENEGARQRAGPGDRRVPEKQ
ncbi:hypothetical protein NDU88_006953 [Pleurodeles waltl]|uniref:Uncharacterized protein n=1 Tax=Pleurodeles waltl TaxID=8319 RepID=A0AAV7TZ27_PLEWA|nr:hypothetical protein NDU88_006953 [Pleurodeles waltl]